MNGDMLNKILIENLAVHDIKTENKRYKVRSVQTLCDSSINVVLYKREGKHKTKVMELQDFIKNFDLVKKITKSITFSRLISNNIGNLAGQKKIEKFLEKYNIDLSYTGLPDTNDRYRSTTYHFIDGSSYKIKNNLISWQNPVKKND